MIAFQGHDFLVGGIYDPLSFHDKLLVEFFPGTKADKLDGNVGFGFLAVESDQTPGLYAGCERVCPYPGKRSPT